MKHIYLFSLLALFSFAVSAQNARVQVIHNSPIPGTNGGPVVDIYLNGNSDMSAPDIPDLEFRSATPFVDLAAGMTQIHIVADGGNPMTDTVLFAEAMLADGETYSVIASGVVASDDTPFGLSIAAGAPAASEVGSNDLLIFHGSPDAPAVIIDAKGVATLESQLEFGQFGDVRRVPNADYVVDVRPGADTTAIVARYQAPLKTLGLDGGAATVFASGFLGTTPAFGVYATLANGATIALPDTVIAQVQIIHNSPFSTTTGGPAVDIFVNGEAPDDGPLKDFQFRTATPFIELPGNVDFTFDVVPAGGTIDQSLFNLPAGELGNNSLAIVAHGIAGNAQQPFNLAILPGARSFATDPGNVDLTVFHGAPDAPAVDVDVVTVGEVVDSLAFGAFNNEGYLEVPEGDYYLGLRVNNTIGALSTFRANLTGLAGGAATVFASGYLANASATGFGLFAALPSGAVAELPVENIARVQIVHAAPVAENVDIWLGGSTKAVPDFAYQTATPFLTIPTDSSISITAPGSSDTSGNFLTIAPNTLSPGFTYYVVARGESLENFGISVSDIAVESADEGTINLQAFHGSPDAPAVDVNVRNVATIFPNLVPNDFGDDYVNVPEDVYLLDITFPGDPNPLFTFVGDLNGLGGNSVLAVASGFVTEENPDSAFTLLAVLPSGDVVPLTRVSIGFANIIHASPAGAADSVDVYIGDLLAIDNFPYLAATGYVELPTNEDITVNLKDSEGPDDGVVLTIPAGTLTEDAVHVVIVHGDGSDDFPITASFIDTARATNSQAGAIDVIAFHGIPGVPAVDVRNGGNLLFPSLIDNLGYGSFSPYLLLPEVEFFLRFTPTGSTDGIATFNNVVLEEDESVVFLATGSVADGDYNMYVVTPDGGVFPSVPQSLVQIIHNAPVPLIDPADIWLATGGEDVGLIRDLAFRDATGVGYFPTRTPYDIGIAPSGSTGSGDAAVSFPVTFEDGVDYVVTAQGTGADQPFELAVQTEGIFANDSGNFDVQVLHGSPDAPDVAISANGTEVIPSLAYGEYAGYLNLANAPLEITVATTEGQVVGTYDAPVETWLTDGRTAGTIFASGLVAPTDDLPAAFELWIAFSNGDTEMLSVITSTNELEKLLTGMTVSPNPMSSNAQVSYALEEAMEVRLRIYSNDGRIIQDQDLGIQGQGEHNVEINAFNLPAGTYHLQLLNERGSVTKRIVVAN